jgi:hypothetical protein
VRWPTVEVDPLTFRFRTVSRPLLMWNGPLNAKES